jgi:hypothetical protein
METVVLTYPLNPSRLDKVTLVCKLPETPGEKVRARGFAETVKSGPVTTIVRLVLRVYDGVGTGFVSATLTVYWPGSVVDGAETVRVV